MPPLIKLLFKITESACVEKVSYGNTETVAQLFYCDYPDVFRFAVYYIVYGRLRYSGER